MDVALCFVAGQRFSECLVVSSYNSLGRTPVSSHPKRSHMTNRRFFGEREQQLFERFAYCQLALTPQQLIERWPGITRNQIAEVCQTDVSRVNRWLSRGRSHESPSPYYLLLLAVFDIFLEFYSQLPESLLDRYSNHE